MSVQLVSCPSLSLCSLHIVCLSVCPSVHLSVISVVCLSVFPSIWISVCLSILSQPLVRTYYVKYNTGTYKTNSIATEGCKECLFISEWIQMMIKFPHSWPFSCNNVALPYFTFWYLQGRVTFHMISTGRKNISMHWLANPMICTLRYGKIVNTSHLILMFLVWM